MKNPTCVSHLRRLAGRNTPKLLLLFTALALPFWSHPVKAQGLTLANPHWNITLSDFGYSDFLLDNTPGFEGREYLSGEWGAAIGYGPELDQEKQETDCERGIGDEERGGIKRGTSCSGAPAGCGRRNSRKRSSDGACAVRGVISRTRRV